ncbi:DUF3019 domain-containing protein [Shewanella sp. VB17]|nr:DUF3019 domain-containing protein [Shewanella sp. VB17]
MTLFLLLCLTITSSKQTLANETEQLRTKLTISPEFCITSDKQLTCELMVQLSWESEQLRSICILSDYEHMAKWCSESAEVNSLNLNISTTEDIQFVMIDKATHETLAKVKLEVTPTVEAKVRRRYRNPWSLF